MRITQIHVEQYAAWRNLHLELPQPGLSVFYGPNEAGKSTLMKLIRGVLYGFPRQTIAPPHYAFWNGDARRTPSAPWEAWLELESDGHNYRLRRTAEAESRGRIALSNRETGDREPAELDAILKGVDETLFESVFAVGLREMQELGTLHEEEVADHIYGMTLGPDGQRLLHVGERIREERSRLLDSTGQTGELADAFTRHAELSSELASLEKSRQRHRELSRQRAKLEAEIEDIQRRQAGIQSQLRGHLFLERVWGPWNRVRECETELAKIPAVNAFPEQGIERLDQLEQDHAEATSSRNNALSHAKRIKKKIAESHPDPEVRSQAGSIQGLLDQRDWIGRIEEQMSQTEADADAIKAELDAKLETLGPPWTLKRLETFETGPEAHFRLANMARSFRAALSRRTRHVRACERWDASCTEQAAAIKTRLLALGETDLEPALVKARERLAILQEIATQKLRETELQKRQADFDLQREQLETRLILPGWIYLVLGCFAFAGVWLMVLGASEGVRTSSLVGTIYALLGATCGGLAWALKKHFETDIHERADDLNAAAEAGLQDLRETHERIVLFSAKVAGSEDRAAAEALAATEEASRIQQANQRIAELEQLRRAERKIAETRQKIVQRGAHQQLCEREVGTARQSWQELLTQLGFPPNLRIEEAFTTWKAIVEATELVRKRDALLKEHAHFRSIAQGHRQKIEELGRRMNRWDRDYDQPADILKEWEETLRSFSASRQERRESRKELKERLREASEYKQLADELKTQTSALLVQGGAADRAEFELRAGHAARRMFLEDQLADARKDLELACRKDRDLAVVEDDLIAYRAQENTEKIELLNMELEDLERDASGAFERLGGLKRELENLEQDRTGTRLAWEREQAATAIKLAGSRWFALETAAQVLHAMRSNFERNCQPATLADASRYLARLTCGKYRQVWTPLGERQLRIDDERQESTLVEDLSSGTREQLFLAIRLAIVSGLARSGVRLPLVLDDVIVNFDQRRAEAAVEVLQDFAAQGSQVLLFTCHSHLTELFERRGIQPMRLPDREELATRSLPETLAG